MCSLAGVPAKRVSNPASGTDFACGCLTYGPSYGYSGSLLFAVDFGVTQWSNDMLTFAGCPCRCTEYAICDCRSIPGCNGKHSRTNFKRAPSCLSCRSAYLIDCFVFFRVMPTGISPRFATKCKGFPQRCPLRQ